jgi:hypothetical protein
MTPSEVDDGHSVMTRPVLSKDPGALSLPLRSSHSERFFPLECFLHSRTQKPADHLCERLIFVRRQVLRDVAQNVSFAGSILDVYRAKEQVILAMLDRDVVVDIPQYDFDILVFPMLVRKLLKH